MSNIFFSIIVPTYNRANLLPKTIESLLNQSYKNFEIIVVDDGSTDNTEEVMKPWVEKGVIYHKKKNEERAVARNTGAKLAKGEYINFFDSDDWAYPNHLETAYQFIEKNHQPEIFHLGYDYKTPEGVLERKVDNLSGDSLNERLIKGNILSCNGVFIRKDIILKHPFVEDRILSASEDYELWLRLAAIYPIRYDNTITSTIINHDARSVLSINKDKLIARQEAFLKHLFADNTSNQKYHSFKSFFKSEAYTYIALHLAITKKHRTEVLQYLLKAFFTKPSVLTRRRFWASLKNIF
ncbi:MAG: glycosyltransferase family 2 protein [Raineya sp.]|jgi:glycosyltransferase involved in cell wall biosynthesis|nr:glycosyltransferase family 2 protein [Raineya sp.]